MKYTILFTLILGLSLSTIAQVPQKMSYQSVIRDQGGELLREQEVAMQISIHQGSPDDTSVFMERHVITTNLNGLASLVIGEGQNISGDISQIKWAFGPFYIKINIDPEGGENYSISGSSELISVPYALFAQEAASGIGGGDTDWVEDVVNDVVYTGRNIALQTAGSQPFRVNSAAPAGMARVIAGTLDGIGVLGNSAMGYGVRGTSDQGVGVHGMVNNFGTAILAEAADGIGLKASSQGSYGVFSESELSVSIEGRSMRDHGIIGRSEDSVGVFGVSDNLYGVMGISNGDDMAGVFGNGKNRNVGVKGIAVNNEGVLGESQHSFGVTGMTKFIMDHEEFKPDRILRGTALKAGVKGMADSSHGGFFYSDIYAGIMTVSNESNGLTGNSKSTDKSKAGVYGTSENTLGIYGFSTNSTGIYGTSDKGVESDITQPATFEAFTTENNMAVLGAADLTFGIAGQSTMNAGVIGNSLSSNGVTGTTNTATVDRAGVAGLATMTAGVLGWSEDGPGVRGKSTTGPAGEFEGEVMIENGPKNAKLWIEEMEDDPTAPCLVWSGDKYVRKRDCWTLEVDTIAETAYFVSSKGIRIKNGNEVVFEVNPDGTSYHKGLETFEEGLIVPLGNEKYIRLLPNDGISIFDNLANDYYFHANPFGDAYAMTSFYTNYLEAINVSANVKQFKIDHPLDPDNKYLIHTSIESDERLNVYSGNVITNLEGLATVELPDWFEALNIDYRYQLTVIGTFAQAIISKEIQNGTFEILTNEPNVKVSWQVSGIRNDKWARENPNQVEVDKKEGETRPYLNK